MPALKKVVEVKKKNQGGSVVLFKFLPIPKESYYGLEEKSFFWHSSFLVTALHISSFLFFIFFPPLFQAAGGISEVENVKAGA